LFRQHVPELLDAIKAQLNRDLRPGRYVLAGSTRYAAIPAAAQALTGRVDIIPVLPLTQGEIDGVPETFVARLLDGDDIEGPSPGADAGTREEYARRAASGGMPVAPVRLPPRVGHRRPARPRGEVGCIPPIDEQQLNKSGIKTDL
jgi:predicted AAA+ superfamily ATPase